ncbi:MAG TPA: hypothetical protein VFG87_15510 [Amycolatopsis sp.]|nr:hypothetical protein [Amycolatopsis sp.]
MTSTFAPRDAGGKRRPRGEREGRDPGTGEFRHGRPGPPSPARLAALAALRARPGSPRGAAPTG